MPLDGNTGLGVPVHYGARTREDTGGVTKTEGVMNEWEKIVRSDGTATGFPIPSLEQVGVLVTEADTTKITGSPSGVTIGVVDVTDATPESPVSISPFDSGLVDVDGATGGRVLIKYKSMLMSTIDDLKASLALLGYPDPINEALFKYLGDLGYTEFTLPERLQAYGGWLKLLKSLPLVDPFAPGKLFVRGADGWWHDISDMSTLWVDQARTQHPTSPGDVVWWIDDKSPNQNHFGAPSSSARGRLYRWPASAVLEGSPRNLIRLTESLDNWVNSGGETTAQTGIADPDGGNNAFRITGLSASGRLSLTGTRVPGNSDTVATVWARSHSGSANLRIYACGTDTGNMPITTEWAEYEIPITTAGSPEGTFQFQIPVGAEVDLYHPSIELGSVAHPYQRVGSGEWDVTEEGQADCWSIRGDGVTTQYLSSRGVPLFQDNKLAIAAGLIKFDDVGTSKVFLANQTTGSTNNAVTFYAPAASQPYTIRYRSTENLQAYVPPGEDHPAIDSVIADIRVSSSPAEVSLQVNNESVYTNTSASAGSINNLTWSLFGYRDGTSLFNGLYFGGVFVNEEPSEETWQVSVKNWLNDKMGNLLGHYKVPESMGFMFPLEYWKDATGAGLLTDLSQHYPDGAFDPVGRGLKVYYVDPELGSDANDGLSWGTAFSSVMTAMNQSDVDAVFCQGGKVYQITSSGTNTITTYTGQRDVSIQAIGDPAIFAPARTVTWTPEGTANVYGSTAAGGAIVNVIDLRNQDAFGAYTTLTPVGSVGEVSTTPNSYFNDGGFAKIRLGDDSEPDENILVMRSTQHNRISSPGTKVHIKNIDFLGGSGGALRALNGNSDSVLVVEDCRFMNCHNGNGLNVRDYGLVISKNCSGISNYDDAFNYHVSNGLNPHFIEIGCKGINSFGPATANGSSAHDFCVGFRINCEYTDNRGPGLIDVNDAKSYNVNIVSKDNTGSSNAMGLSTYGGTAEMWVDGFETSGNQSYDINVIETATLHIRDAVYDEGKVNVDVTATMDEDFSQ